MSDSPQPSLKELRWDYAAGTLHRDDLSADPIEQFGKWFLDAVDAGIREPNAMTLATLGLDGYPTTRTVLMKDYAMEGITFFTNYESRKGHELEAGPRVSLLFFWRELERQVQFRGSVSKVSAQESDDYFQSRPYDSRIGAWASEQSKEIPNRSWLDDRVTEFSNRYPDTGEPGCVPRPPFWGGYRVAPEWVEFWQGQPARKHDRFIYHCKGNDWSLARHSP